MQKISTFSFGSLKNAEHVSFFTNVAVTIDKVTSAALGIAESLYKQYKDAVLVEQDIVNHSTGSIYTPEMQALDNERDRLYRLIRLRLQACTLASQSSAVAQYATTIDKYILTKYGLDVASAPYQEESALIRGFILDMRNLFSENVIESFGVASELTALEEANDSFADQYNERVTEKSGSTTEATKKARKATEDLFDLMALHLEYKANTDSTDMGVACGEQVAIINELIKDARLRLNMRLGKVVNEDLPVASPVPLN